MRSSGSIGRRVPVGSGGCLNIRGIRRFVKRLL
jgi:hypothetical protein